MAKQTETVFTGFRKTEEARKINCPHPDYLDAYVVLPAEWLGIHAIRKERAVANLANIKSTEALDFAVAMSLVEDWDGIPGLEEKDPQYWRVDITPLPIINWISQVVWQDYKSAYIVPKVSP